jgi:hypothetical protein
MGSGSNLGRSLRIGRVRVKGRAGRGGAVAGALLRGGGSPEKAVWGYRGSFGLRLGAKERVRHAWSTGLCTRVRDGRSGVLGGEVGAAAVENAGEGRSGQCLC